MATASEHGPWWASEYFADFREFGWATLYPAFGYSDAITFTIRLFDPAATTYEAIRKSSFDFSERAIAKAQEKFFLREFEFRMVQRDGYPLEATLELTIAEKRES